TPIIATRSGISLKFRVQGFESRVFRSNPRPGTRDARLVDGGYLTTFFGSLSLNSCLSTLPDGLRGKASINSTSRGAVQTAIRSRQKSISSCLIRRAPAFLTTNAFTASPETGDEIPIAAASTMPSCFAKTSSTSRGQWILISAKAAGKLRADLFVLRPRLCLFVPEPEKNIHLPLSKKKASGLRKWLGFLVNVPFWSALNLTLIQRVRSSTLGDRKKPSCGRDGIMTDWSLAQGKNYIRIHGVSNLWQNFVTSY